MVALDDEANIMDFVVISNGDTQGIGTKVTEESFANALKSKNSVEDTLDTISGATVSSRPIVDGIKEAGDYLLNQLK